MVPRPGIRLELRPHARTSRGSRLLSPVGVAVLVAFAAGCSGMDGGAAAGDRAARIGEVVSAFHEAGQFNGSVLVAAAGEVLFENGVGWANVEWEVPNTPDTKHRIGSVTKQFTSALVLQLVEEGEIALDAPIATYLPGYPEPQGSKVTVHHLLNHTSGIPSYTGLPDFGDMMRDPYTPDDLIAVVSSMPLEFEPGSRFAYNNSGYFILGRILENVTGEEYADVLRERLLEPLGLHDSGYDDHAGIEPREASGYVNTLSGFEHASYLDTTLPYAAGMMYSTVRDLYRWDRALYDGATPFAKPETKELWFTPGLDDYAYGWHVSDEQIGDEGPTVRVIEHGGGINGFSTAFRRYPDGERTVIVIDNAQGNSGAVADQIARVLYDQPVEAARPEIARALVSTFEEEGADAGIAEYRRLRAESPDAFDFSEPQLNLLGYHFRRKGDTETAIAVFALNVEQYPDAFNTYDSLGEAYKEAGRTDLAIANYEKSLELNPGNANGRAMLAEMGVETAEAEGLALSTEVLERYVGDYEIRPGFVLTVTRDGTRLFTQATGQPRFEIFSQSETRFFVKDFPAQLEFHVEGDGPAASVTLFQGGRETPAKRMD
jgi:CubicO group peptidase (beta-lactamase class C family)